MQKKRNDGMIHNIINALLRPAEATFFFLFSSFFFFFFFPLFFPFLFFLLQLSPAVRYLV